VVPKITIVVPVHNEARILEQNILKTRDTALSILPNFEIVIAEDGSKDGSDKIAARLAKKYKEIKFIHSDERLGKGEAIKRAFKNFNPDIFVLMDADLSVEPNFLPNLIEKIKNGSDIVIGSRMAHGSKVKRSLKRNVASKTYNWLVRRFFDVDFTDMQCGFKAFTSDAISNIIDSVEERHWFFDTELLIRANMAGYSIEEIPIEWEEKSHKIKIIKDGRDMISKLIKFWWKMKFEKEN